MGDLEGFENNINATLEKIDREITSLLKKDQTAKKSSYKKIENWISSTNTVMQSYDLEITELDTEDQGEHKEKLKVFTARLEKLKQQYHLKKQEGTVDLYDGHREQNQDVSQMTAQEMIELGDRTQAQGDEALDNIERMVNDGIDLSRKINEDLDKQIEQLDRLYDTVKDTQSELKRSQKYLKYFARNLYTDKIVMCLIFLVLVGIIALIVLSAMGYGSTKSNTTDQVNGGVTNDTTDTSTDNTDEITSRMLIGFLQ